LKTIIKLLIVVAILNACARGAMAAWTYYQFKDATSQTILFGGNATVGDLEALILRRAAEYEVPIDPKNLEVTRDGPRTVAAATYRQEIELFPGYRRPFDLSFKVDALSVSQQKPGEAP
jgi:hypothetical protein